MKKKYIHPLQFGSFTLPNNIIYSPLAGCSDWPFRKMVARYGQAGLMYCEMVKMDALVRFDPNTLHILDYSKEMHPIGAQLVGSKENLAAPAARILEDMGFDVIDLNCGCPVDKVTRDCSGSGLLKHPERIGEIISNIVAAVRVPVTVKIRTGWDEENIVAPEITRIAEQAGAQAIAIHGRTRKQGYRGVADREIIKSCVEARSKIKVLGNGDIFTPESAFHMFSYTGCDGILVSRGTMGAPWIGADIIAADDGIQIPERSLEERKKMLFEHLDYTLAYHSDKKAAIEMRRVGNWYFPKDPATRDFRRALSRASCIDYVKQLIQEFGSAVDQELVV